MVQLLNKTDIDWRGHTPSAPAFGDIYFSPENGLAESNFVFLDGIQAPDSWQNKDQFVVAETGFGTGLNFLATYKKWIESNAPGRLTYISTERYPLSEEALKKAHQAFSSLENYARQLRQAWPPPSHGFHPRFFENGKIQLLLLFGDAESTLTELQAEVDAWFLDGFSPAKNPEMWSDRLFDQIARLSKPKARFATFTAAGFVRRSLEARGFVVKKTQGFGQKRNRLLGQMKAEHRPTPPLKAPEWAKLSNTTEGPTTIVGAGIAGLSLAAALGRRSRQSSVIGARSYPAASEVPAAILAPGFQAGPQPTTDFVTSAFAQACWLPQYRNAWSDVRGVELFAGSAAEAKRFKRIEEALGWGPDWVSMTENGLSYPRSGSLNTAATLANISETLAIETATIQRIEKTSAGWLLIGEGIKRETRNLILAAGAGTANLAKNANNFGFTARAGQIETLLASDADLPEKSLAASGYITAPIDGSQTLGSTFSDFGGDERAAPQTTNSATVEILAKVEAEFGISVGAETPLTSWAGIRAATKDYMPLIGPVPAWQAAAEQFAPLSIDRKITGLGPMQYQDGLFLLTGFGSKGFQQAPYAAEYLAAHLCGDPLPMAAKVAAYLHPARSFIRRIIRGD